ncbi:MAG: rhodanese-like domain-containing protein [Polyangiales bacterium]
MGVFERARNWVPFGEVPEVDPEALHSTLDGVDAPIVLDVRTETEWRAGHVRGALSAPITDFESALDALSLDPARSVVAICLSAHRSIPAVRILRARGFTRAAQLRGGMLAWWVRGLPTTRE